MGGAHRSRGAHERRLPVPRPRLPWQLGARTLVARVCGRLARPAASPRRPGWLVSDHSHEDLEKTVGGDSYHALMPVHSTVVPQEHCNFNECELSVNRMRCCSIVLPH
jgi:hypothetical protein